VRSYVPSAELGSWRGDKAHEKVKSLPGRQEYSQLRDTPVFAALADPTRRQLLLDLAEHSPRTATQLAAEYPITRQGILKHLNILEEAGLVTVYQRGREKRYTLTPEPLTELEQWIKEISARWDERLLRLKTFIESEAEEVVSEDPTSSTIS
jgi:DNA-binding transcriptional ArsR family regulator